MILFSPYTTKPPMFPKVVLYNKRLIGVPRENRTLVAGSTDRSFTTKLWAPYTYKTYVMTVIPNKAHISPVFKVRYNIGMNNKHLINNIDPYDFEVEKIGEATLYTKNVPWSSVIHVRFLFNFGALHDDEGKEGTAHFLEHMIFQGNPLYKDKFEIDQFSKTYTLDSLNAFTGFNHVSVHFRCLPEHLGDALEGTYNMIQKSYLRDEDIESERSIITQEAWGRYINEEHIAYIKKELKNLFHTVPDRLRINRPLGWPDTIKNIQKSDLEKVRDFGFTQKTLSVVVAGVVNEEVKKTIRDCVLKFPEGNEIKKIYIPNEVTAPLEKIWVYTKKEMGLTNNKQAGVNLSAGTIKNYPCTDAVKDLTSNLLRELLFKEIRHNHSWCYKVSASFGSTEDFTFGELGTTIEPDHVIETVKLLKQVVEEVIDGKHLKEFDQEKKLMIDRKLAVELTTDDIASKATGDLRMDGEIENRKKSFENLEAVSYEDITKLLTELFKGKTLLCEVFLPDEYKTEDIKSALKTILS